MKHLFFVTVIAALLLTANFVNAKNSLFGNTLTNFGTYQLTPSSKSVVIDNVSYKTWELKYSGNPEKYQIYLVPGANGKHSYKIVGKDMELVYNIEADNFGAAYIEPVSQTIGGKSVAAKELKAQIMKTPVMGSAEYLDLVACLMPRLMN
jgi:hypothetical protein